MSAYPGANKDLPCDGPLPPAVEPVITLESEREFTAEKGSTLGKSESEGTAGGT